MRRRGWVNCFFSQAAPAKAKKKLFQASERSVSQHDQLKIRSFKSKHKSSLIIGNQYHSLVFNMSLLWPGAQKISLFFSSKLLVFAFVCF